MPATSSKNESKQKALYGIPYCIPFGNFLIVKNVDLFYTMEDGTPIKVRTENGDKDAVIIRWGLGSEHYTKQLSDFVPSYIANGAYLSKSRLANTTFFNFNGLTESRDCIHKINWDNVSIGDKDYKIIQYVDYESHFLNVTHTIIHLLPQRIVHRDPLTDEVIHEEEFDPIEIGEDMELVEDITITSKDFVLLKPEEFDERRLDTNPTFRAEAAQTETTATPLSKPPSISLKKDIEKMRLALQEHNIQHLYHITHESNLDGILIHGLLSHNSAHDYGIVKKDISMRDVNALRNRIEPVFNKNLHDYVPLYFNAHNPMMYVRHLTESNLVVIEISSDVLLRDKVLYSDGNAASHITKFYTSDEDFGKLNFKIIQGESWNRIPDGKRIICSEVLVDTRVDTQYFERVIVRTREQKSRLSGIVEKVPHLNIKLNPTLFFG